MADTKAEDPAQLTASDERLNILWSILSSPGKGSQDLLENNQNETVRIDGSEVAALRISESDLKHFIKHRGCTWKHLRQYQKCIRDRIAKKFIPKRCLVVGPVLVVSGQIRKEYSDYYSYIVSLGPKHISRYWYYYPPCLNTFREQFNVYAMEEPTKANHSELLSTLTTLSNLLLDTSDDPYLDHTFSLSLPCQYKLLQELKICVSKVNLCKYAQVTDPGFCKWIVESSKTLIVHRHQFSDDAWKMFVNTLVGETAKVKYLAISTKRFGLPIDELFEFDYDSEASDEGELAGIIQKASTIKKLYIAVAHSNDLNPFAHVRPEGDRCIELEVEGRMHCDFAVDWLSCLAAVLRCTLFSSITYFVYFHDDRGVECGYYKFDDIADKTILDCVLSNESLVHLYFPDENQDCGENEMINSTFKKRKWQKQALKFVSLLDDHIMGPTLFGELICNKHVSGTPRVLYSMISKNVPLVKLRPKAEVKAVRQAIAERKARKERREMEKWKAMQKAEEQRRIRKRARRAASNVRKAEAMVNPKEEVETKAKAEPKPEAEASSEADVKAAQKLIAVQRVIEAEKKQRKSLKNARRRANRKVRAKAKAEVESKAKADAKAEAMAKAAETAIEEQKVVEEEKKRRKRMRNARQKAKRKARAETKAKATTGAEVGSKVGEKSDMEVTTEAEATTQSETKKRKLIH